jgi:hypothetical protein
VTLRLEIAEFKDADHWRWRLTDAGGAFLADHAVALDQNEPQYQALFNLPAYLWQLSAPDKRDQDERRLLNEVGAWVGETVLGREIGEKILASGFPPIIVRVIVPQAAERLLVNRLRSRTSVESRWRCKASAWFSRRQARRRRRPPRSATGYGCSRCSAYRLPAARSICAASGRCCARLFATYPGRRSSCTFFNMASHATASVASYRKEMAGIFCIFLVTGYQARWFSRSLTAAQT